MNNKLIIIGGDERQRKLCAILGEKGYNCVLLNESAENINDIISGFPLLIFPVPLTSDGVYIYSDNPEFKVDAVKTAACVGRNQLVLGGMINDEIKGVFEKNDVVYTDICKIEYFTKYNAFLTAQAALKLLLLNTDKFIVGKTVLITGFGRIGKALADMLNSLGMKVTVAARRKEQLSEAECSGYGAIHLSEAGDMIYLFDFIFNTVPENILFEADICSIRHDSIFFELASKPYGADVSFFKKHNKKHISAGGLPGKHVSFSAAEIIAELAENFIQKGREI